MCLEKEKKRKNTKFQAKGHRSIGFLRPGEKTGRESREIRWSRTTKQVALLELTGPWEERIEEAHKHKLGKYQSLILENQQREWRAWNLLVEGGCRGFPGQSLWKALESLGKRVSPQEIGQGHHQADGDSVQMILAEEE
eukprot:superscaffoldBa00000132_g1931